MSEKENKNNKNLNYDEKYRNKYSSLGEAIVKGDFKYFNNELEIWVIEDSYDFKGLFNHVKNRFGEQGFGTVLDTMLLNIPKYALNENGSLREGVIEAVDLLFSLGAEPLLEFTKTIYGDYETNFVREVASLPDDTLLRHLFKANFWDDLVDTEDIAGLDFLHAAIVNGSVKNVEFLIKEQGFDVNKKYDMQDNVTPIFYSVGRNKPEVFDKLVELGANLHAKNSKGETIIDFLSSELNGFQDRYSKEEQEVIVAFNQKVKALFKATVEPEKPKRKLRTAF